MTLPPIPGLAERLADNDRRSARRPVVDIDRSVRIVWIVYGLFVVIIGIVLGAFLAKMFG